MIDLADALGTFARVAAELRRPDLMRVALTEQYSLAQLFQGPKAQEQLERITASLASLHQAAPDVPVVVPGPGAWRLRGSYPDLLAEPAPPSASSGAGIGSGSGRFAARLAAETRLAAESPAAEESRFVGSVAEGRAAADPSVIAGWAARLERGVALAGAGRAGDVDRIAEADRLLAGLADELGLDDAVTPDPVRRDVRRLWSAALYERAMLLHSLGHSDDAWDVAWLSVVVAVRRHEGLERDSAAEREALADATTHMVDAATVAAAAGRPEDQIMLLSEAVDRCADAAGPRLRHILGTALHNLAAALRGRPEAAERLAEHACAVRRELAESGGERAIRDHAHSLLLAANLAVNRQGWAVAVDRLAAVGRLLVAGRGYPEAMLRHAEQLAAEAAVQAPELVSRARAAGSWPFQ